MPTCNPIADQCPVIQLRQRLSDLPKISDERVTALHFLHCVISDRVVQPAGSLADLSRPVDPGVPTPGQKRLTTEGLVWAKNRPSPVDLRNHGCTDCQS